MALQKLLSVEDNTAPPIIITCVRNNSDGTQTAIDVTGCTVDLIVNFGGTVVNSGHTSCALTTPSSGIVTYTTVTGDFSNIGTYNCEVKITYNDGSIETLREEFQVNARKKLS